MKNKIRRWYVSVVVCFSLWSEDCGDGTARMLRPSILIITLYHLFIILKSGEMLTITMRKKINVRHAKMSTTDTGGSHTFYESIGSPKFISAPMVEQSALSWRLLAKSNGCDIAFSQMMHARNFVNDIKYRNDCIDWLCYRHISGDDALERKAMELDNKLIVQLAGDDPDILVKAAKVIEDGIIQTNQKSSRASNVAAIDLNLGCPQKIAKRGNYGAYLMKNNRDLTIKCLSDLVSKIKTPITCKIRVFDDDKDTIDFVRRLEDTGIKMITIHGRTVLQSKLFTGQANWDIIRKCKEVLSIPVIANGGIESYSDAITCLEATGCDGIMSSEGLLENPKLFSKFEEQKFNEDYINCQFDSVDQYLAYVKSYPMPRTIINQARSHMFKMLHRFTDCDYNSEFRKVLSEGNLEEMETSFNDLKAKFSRHNNDYKYCLDNEYLSSTSWYLRHRDESSKFRVISPRRVDRKRGVSQSTTNTTDLAEKIQNLKHKLLEKRSKQQIIK